MAKHRTLIVAAALAAASLALPAAAQPRSVAGIDVTAKAPTTARVSIVGKDKATVRKDVAVAAHTVCRNAFGNHELELGDLKWCGDTAQYKAMKQYAKIVRNRAFADAGYIVLSAR